MNYKIDKIIYDYQNIIRDDGEVSRNELKKMLMMDDEILSIYKTSSKINSLINMILKPRERKSTHPDKAEIDERLRLSNDGMTDSDIAKIQSRCVASITRWRHERNLQSNMKKINKNKMNERIKLYYQGYSAKEIAEITGDKKSAIENYIYKLKKGGKIKNRSAGTGTAQK